LFILFGVGLTVLTVTSLAIRTIPGTVADARAAEGAGQGLGISRAEPEKKRAWYDELPFRSGLGESLYYDMPVIDLLRDRLPTSLWLFFCSFILVHGVALTWGPFGALRSGFDFFGGILSFVYVVPAFTLAYFLIYFFCGSHFLPLFPPGGLVSENFSELSLASRAGDLLWHSVLPIFCYSLTAAVVTSHLVRETIRRQGSAGFTQAAFAKGLTPRGAARSVRKNSYGPVAAALPQWPHLIFDAGIVIESLFNLHGIGALEYESVLHRDYPVLISLVSLFVIFQVTFFFLSDLLLLIVDPRRGNPA
jgi:microcin C transport system permease protein